MSLTFNVYAYGNRLEDLNQWGNLENLIWPLDSPVWLHALAGTLDGADDCPVGGSSFLTIRVTADYITSNANIGQGYLNAGFLGHDWITRVR